MAEIKGALLQWADTPEGSYGEGVSRPKSGSRTKEFRLIVYPKGAKPPARRIDLTPPKAYQTLITYGRPNLRDYVRRLEVQPLSPVGHTAARDTPLLGHLTKGKGHQDVKLDADSLSRLVTWMDTYAQRLGHFSDEQERRLLAFRARAAPLLAERE